MSLAVRGMGRGPLVTCGMGRVSPREALLELIATLLPAAWRVALTEAGWRAAVVRRG